MKYSNLPAHWSQPHAGCLFETPANDDFGGGGDKDNGDRNDATSKNDNFDKIIV